MAARKKRSGIMLAYPYEQRRLSDPKIKLTFPVIVQPTLDGERCRALRDENGNVHLLSSTEEEIISFPHIIEELQQTWNKQPGRENILELDGELYLHGLDFNEIHSIVSRRKELHPDYSTMQYHIFDIIPHAEEMTQMRRSSIVSQLFPDSSAIKIVRSSVAASVEVAEAHLETYEDQGFEGVIIRHPELKYVRKRSIHMLKFKPKKSDTHPLLDVIEAVSKDGQPFEMTGTLVLGESLSAAFEVGCGKLTHPERRHLWQAHQKNETTGMFVHYQYQASQPKTGKPRFGRAYRLTMGIIGKTVYGQSLEE